MTFEDWMKDKYYNSKKNEKYSKYQRFAVMIGVAAYNRIPSYSKLKNKQGREDLIQVAREAMLEDLKRIYTDKSLFKKLYNKKNDDMTVGPYYMKGNHKTITICKKDSRSIKFIKGRVIDFLRENDPVDPKTRKKINKIKKFSDDYYKKNGDYPSTEELEEGLKIPIRKIYEILNSEVSETYYEEYMECNMNVKLNKIRSTVEIFESNHIKSEYDIETAIESSKLNGERKKKKYQQGKLESDDENKEFLKDTSVEEIYEESNMKDREIYNMILDDFHMTDDHLYSKSLLDLFTRYAVDRESLDKDELKIVKDVMDYSGIILDENPAIGDFFRCKYLFYPEKSRIKSMDIAFRIQKFISKLNGVY